MEFTYTYKCSKCKKVVELRRLMDDRGNPVVGEKHSKRGCDGEFRQIITAVSVPFEHLRDKGVFERIEKY